MKYFIVLLPVVFSGYVKAQSIMPITSNNGGQAGVVGSIHFEFNLGESFVTTIGTNTFITQGLLQPISATPASLPVTGLQFTARRISEDKVQLNWRTVQEINNHGFSIERKRENENEFTTLNFVRSKALNGNSHLPLQYDAVDINNFKGISYYRLKQTDTDGKSAYSIVCIVNGTPSDRITLKAWPIPSRGDFTVTVGGIDKGILQLFDATGRMVRQVPITNGTQQKITGISPGTYMIRLAEHKHLVQVVLVQ
ncbi:MAG TPA: T9SS type A sorting domain-containing protein [Chitinophagaceae bacterium]|nr:T9SS type A sorting domain-containing protein [Chitinophagaceae bacterium]